MYFLEKTKMKEITFPTMGFIIVNIQETKLYTYGLIDTGLEITIFKNFLLKEWKDTKISIKGVTGNKVMVLFLPIMGWIFSKSLGRSSRSNRCTTYNLH